MGCLVLCRTFHIVPEQGQGRMGYVPIIHVLKLFQVVRFKSYFNGFQVLSPGPTHCHLTFIRSVSTVRNTSNQIDLQWNLF